MVVIVTLSWVGIWCGPVVRRDVLTILLISNKFICVLLSPWIGRCNQGSVWPCVVEWSCRDCIKEKVAAHTGPAPILSARVSLPVGWLVYWLAIGMSWRNVEIMMVCPAGHMNRLPAVISLRWPELIPLILEMDRSLELSSNP